MARTPLEIFICLKNRQIQDLPWGRSSWQRQVRSHRSAVLARPGTPRAGSDVDG